MTLYPYPKPKSRPTRVRGGCRLTTRTPLKRGKALKAKRVPKAYAHLRDKKYTKWLTTENPCLLAGTITRGRITLNDHCISAFYRVPERMAFEHACWSGPDRPPIDPAHVGKHRSQGVPDLGVTVPLCHAAHAFYDGHRDKWAKATGYTEKKMASAASGYALKYVESGGKAA